MSMTPFAEQPRSGPPTRRRWTAVLLAAVAVAAVACGAGGGSTGPARDGVSTAPATTTTAGPSTPPSTTRPPVTTPARPSAATRLTDFLDGAQQQDNQLRAAATLINGGVRATTIEFGPNTLAAIRAIDPRALARTIPGGMSAQLTAKVFLVYSELAARRYAFQPILWLPSGPVARGGDEAREVLEGLANGAVPAARFPADLAALRALVAQSGPIPAVAPDSRATAEIAVQAEYVIGVNSGCAAKGGWWETTLAPIEWDPGVVFDSHQVTGVLLGAHFQAAYHRGSGWQVTFRAC